MDYINIPEPLFQQADTFKVDRYTGRSLGKWATYYVLRLAA